MNVQERITALLQKLAEQPEQEMPCERTRTFTKLAMQYAYAGLPRDGLAAVKQALLLAKLHDFEFERAQALTAAAMCHHIRVDHQMSIACGLDAYLGFAALNEYGQMGHTLTTLAAACQGLQACDLAEQALRGCLSIAAHTGDKFLEARCRNTLGLTLTDCRRFDEAEQEFISSRQCLIELGELVHVPRVTINMGELCAKRADAALLSGDEILAKTLFLASIQLARDGLKAALADGNKFEIGNTTASIGEYYFFLKDISTARLLIAQSHEIGCELKHARMIVNCEHWLGRIEMADGRLPEAAAHFLNAIDRARQADLRSPQQAAHQYLAVCYFEMNQPDDANAQDSLATEMKVAFNNANQEAQRELRMMWSNYFSHHPMIINNEANANLRADPKQRAA